MQIVIDIPDSLYENILICWENIHPKVWKILKNGRPLPKGHGRLADLDEALKCVEETADCNEKYYAMCLFDWAMSKRVVLEADKESEDKK